MPLKTTNIEEVPAINLTSMIDVLFLLIIFFMVGTRFTENEHQIRLSLPKSSQPLTMSDRPAAKIVTVFADGMIDLDGQRMTSSDVTSVLAGAVRNYPDLQVQFRADRGCSVEQASMVMEAISRSGVRDIGWTTTATRMPGSHIR
jgi:biopolymer transport protein ExbD